MTNTKSSCKECCLCLYSCKKKRAPFLFTSVLLPPFSVWRLPATQQLESYFQFGVISAISRVLVDFRSRLSHGLLWVVASVP